ncbi:MAG TPA: DNA polymerase ligase N-terminal domain-containing protein [Thermodesulfobacteriota bacterium]|nr:DNA polymerase ligase N-terminal domain-containing protein [Thermodesulfobacteriota bacterium]
MNGTQLRFIIQKHKTHHPHYDLRLETDRGFRSWILLKEPPTDKNVRGLAIEDGEKDASSIISSGKTIEDGYGAGEAEIWDSGIYKIKKKNKSKIMFKAEGKRFLGSFILLFPNWGRWSKKPLWVLIKY